MRRWPRSKCTSATGAPCAASSPAPTPSRETNRGDGRQKDRTTKSRANNLRPPSRLSTTCKSDTDAPRTGRRLGSWFMPKASVAPRSETEQHLRIPPALGSDVSVFTVVFANIRDIYSEFAPLQSYSRDIDLKHISCRRGGHLASSESTVCV